MEDYDLEVAVARQVQGDISLLLKRLSNDDEHDVPHFEDHAKHVRNHLIAKLSSQKDGKGSNDTVSMSKELILAEHGLYDFGKFSTLFGLCWIILHVQSANMTSSNGRCID